MTPPQIFHLPRPSRLTQYIHAHVRSLDIEIDTVREVLNHYRLELATPPRNLPLGRRSRNVVVNTSAGKKVLKRYRHTWQVPVIIYGHSILTRLAKLNFPAPRLVATPDGDTFVSLDGKNYALFNFVEGTNYSSSYVLRANWLKLVALAGQTLARFHRQLEGFLPNGHHHLGFKSYVEDRQRDLVWYVEQLNELKEKSQYLIGLEAKVFVEWLMQNTDPMLKELHWLDKVLNTASLPRLVIHGDYAIQNLLFQRDGAVTPMDLELARLEWRLSDLVTSLIRFRYARGGFDLESMRRFVTAYQAEYPLSAEEWQYLPQVWQFRRIKRAVLSWKSYFESGEMMHRLISAREAVDQANWALSHRDELLALNPVSLQTRW